MIIFGRDRSHTVRWYDPEIDLVVEVTFERKLMDANGAAWKRVTKMGFGGHFTIPSVNYTANWSVRHLTGPEPYQATNIDPVSEPFRFAAAVQTAIGLLLCEVDDQLPGPGFRIVTESEDE